MNTNYMTALECVWANYQEEYLTPVSKPLKL